MGLVKKNFFTFATKKQPMYFESGQKLAPITLAYETYGTLSPKQDNAVLVLHALTGDSHAAGYYTPKDPKPGWWEFMVGPGKGIDTNKFFVICSNVLGGCMGSTGPSSIDPETNRPYGLTFPLLTIGDMVQAQKKLIEHLGIEKLLATVGGSMGGMQALEWSVRFPELAQTTVAIATTSKHSAMAIAFNEVARQAIMSDPCWNLGNYYQGSPPEHGQAVARMIGHVTYLSDVALRKKFNPGRKKERNFPVIGAKQPSTQDRVQETSELQAINFSLDPEFQVGSYLRHQGQKFVQRFDANSLLYLSRATDCFNLAENHGQGSLAQAFSKAKAKYLIISFSSDWLYPTAQSKELVQAMKKNGLEVTFCELKSDYGHDSFLLPNTRLSQIITRFLQNHLQ